VLEPETFAALITKVLRFYAEFSSGIHTNMPLEDAIPLEVLAKDIRVKDIKNGTGVANGIFSGGYTHYAASSHNQKDIRER